MGVRGTFSADEVLVFEMRHNKDVTDNSYNTSGYYHDRKRYARELPMQISRRYIERVTTGLSW